MRAPAATQRVTPSRERGVVRTHTRTALTRPASGSGLEGRPPWALHNELNHRRVAKLDRHPAPTQSRHQLGKPAGALLAEGGMASPLITRCIRHRLLLLRRQHRPADNPTDMWRTRRSQGGLGPPTARARPCAPLLSLTPKRTQTLHAHRNRMRVLLNFWATHGVKRACQKACRQGALLAIDALTIFLTTPLGPDPPFCNHPKRRHRHAPPHTHEEHAPLTSSESKASLRRGLGGAPRSCRSWLRFGRNPALSAHSCEGKFQSWVSAPACQEPKRKARRKPLLTPFAARKHKRLGHERGHFPRRCVAISELPKV